MNVLRLILSIIIIGGDYKNVDSPLVECLGDGTIALCNFENVILVERWAAQIHGLHGALYILNVFL